MREDEKGELVNYDSLKWELYPEDSFLQLFSYKLYYFDSLDLAIYLEQKEFFRKMVNGFLLLTVFTKKLYGRYPTGF